MKNWEKNIRDIMPFMVAGITWRKTASGEIKKCEGEDCDNCGFFSYNGSCSDEKLKWLNSEYEEPKKIDWDNDIDWDRVPVDTPVLVRNSENESWMKEHFAERNGQCGCGTWINGMTSFTGDGWRTIHWKYCKLARPEDIEKYRKKGDEDDWNEVDSGNGEITR